MSVIFLWIEDTVHLIGIDPEDWKQFQKYIRYLWDKNIMIVAAAGNKGPNPMTLSPIGECGGCVRGMD